MAVTDPIADMLTRIRNSTLARHEHVAIPASKLKLEISKVLKAQGYIQKYDLVDDKRHGQIRIHLRYGQGGTPIIAGVRRVSRPGLRIYKASRDIPHVMNGLGIAIVSTSQGVMTDRKARASGVGGEVLCIVA